MKGFLSQLHKKHKSDRKVFNENNPYGIRIFQRQRQPQTLKKYLPPIDFQNPQLFPSQPVPAQSAPSDPSSLQSSIKFAPELMNLPLSKKMSGYRRKTNNSRKAKTIQKLILDLQRILNKKEKQRQIRGVMRILNEQDYRGFLLQIDAHCLLMYLRQQVRNKDYALSMQDISVLVAEQILLYMQKNYKQKRYKFVKVCSIVLKGIGLYNVSVSDWLDKIVLMNSELLKGMDLTEYQENSRKKDRKNMGEIEELEDLQDIKEMRVKEDGGKSGKQMQYEQQNEQYLDLSLSLIQREYQEYQEECRIIDYTMNNDKKKEEFPEKQLEVKQQLEVQEQAQQHPQKHNKQQQQQQQQPQHSQIPENPQIKENPQILQKCTHPHQQQQLIILPHNIYNNNEYEESQVPQQNVENVENVRQERERQLLEVYNQLKLNIDLHEQDQQQEQEQKQNKWGFWKNFQKLIDDDGFFISAENQIKPQREQKASQDSDEEDEDESWDESEFYNEESYRPTRQKSKIKTKKAQSKRSKLTKRQKKTQNKSKKQQKKPSNPRKPRKSTKQPQKKWQQYLASLIDNPKTTTNKPKTRLTHSNNYNEEDNNENNNEDEVDRLPEDFVENIGKKMQNIFINFVQTVIKAESSHLQLHPDVLIGICERQSSFSLQGIRNNLSFSRQSPTADYVQNTNISIDGDNYQVDNTEGQILWNSDEIQNTINMDIGNISFLQESSMHIDPNSNLEYGYSVLSQQNLFYKQEQALEHEDPQPYPQLQPQLQLEQEQQYGEQYGIKKETEQKIKSQEQQEEIGEEGQEDNKIFNYSLKQEPDNYQQSKFPQNEQQQEI